MTSRWHGPERSHSDDCSEICVLSYMYTPAGHALLGELIGKQSQHEVLWLRYGESMPVEEIARGSKDVVPR
jgi:hypothetical protein